MLQCELRKTIEDNKERSSPQWSLHLNKEVARKLLTNIHKNNTDNSEHLIQVVLE